MASTRRPDRPPRRPDRPARDELPPTRWGRVALAVVGLIVGGLIVVIGLATLGAGGSGDQPTTVPTIIIERPGGTTPPATR